MLHDLFSLLILQKPRHLTNADIKAVHFAPTQAGNFTAHYRKHIFPHIKAFEKARLKALRTFRKNILYSAAITGAAIIIALATWPHIDAAPDDIIQIYSALAIFGSTGIAYWVTRPLNEYRNKTENEIYPHIFKFFGADFEYMAQAPLSISTYKPFGLFSDYDRENLTSYVKGSYKQVALQLIQTKLIKHVQRGKHKHDKTVFQGMCVHLSVHKNFKGHTLIKTDHGFMNWATNAFQKLERIKLEDPVFEKAFEVFGTDQIEARYLLSTSFMQRLLDVKTRFKGAKIQCAFLGGHLLITIPSKRDFFAPPPIFKPVTFQDDINTILDDMTLFFSIIETLRLDEHTGL